MRFDDTEFNVGDNDIDLWIAIDLWIDIDLWIANDDGRRSQADQAAADTA